MVGKYKVSHALWQHPLQRAVHGCPEAADACGLYRHQRRLFGHAGDQEVWDGMDEGTLSKTKEMLDDMHKRKIDMADEIYVINVGGYIGDSTRSEIQYAEEHGKPVRYYQNIRK